MKAKKGFTLIELLVVISIIALLIAILMPALNHARKHATGAACLANLKTLALCWTMYADDNDDKICSSEVFGNPNQFEPQDWVHPWIGTGHPNYYPGMSDHLMELEGIKLGGLYLYTNNVDVYNCPGDKEWRRATGYSGQTSPFRSYAGSLAMYGRWNMGGPERYFKTTQIDFPAGKFIYLEEQELGGTNWGSWILPTNPTDLRWWDPIAIWHSKSSTNFDFADGHAENKNWSSKSTLFMAETQMQGVDPSNPNHDGDGNYDDLQWMRRVYHKNYEFDIP